MTIDIGKFFKYFFVFSPIQSTMFYLKYAGCLANQVNLGKIREMFMSKIYKGKIRGVDCILIKSGIFQGNCVSFSKLIP